MIGRSASYKKIETLHLLQPTATEMDPTIREGSAVLSFVWFEVAKRVVETAIRVYDLTPEQIVAVKKVFLRAGDYVVEAA